MNCCKCNQPMQKRVIKPYGIKQPVTVYECRSALCEHDEDEYVWRRGCQRFR